MCHHKITYCILHTLAQVECERHRVMFLLINCQNKEGMALSARPNITRLDHTLQQLTSNTISTLQAGESQGKYLKHRIIVHTNYWYRTTQKYSIIYTGVVVPHYH